MTSTDMTNLVKNLNDAISKIGQALANSPALLALVENNRRFNAIGKLGPFELLVFDDHEETDVMADYVEHLRREGQSE